LDQPFRTFCAIELSSRIRSRIQQQIDNLRAAIPKHHASWARVENLHLTIKFFGEVEQSKIARIASAAARAIDNLSRFETSISGTGAFPKTSQPRVLWIGIEDQTGKLRELHEEFEKECATEGFSKEERGFRPHLTIARIRKPEGARALAELNQKLGFESMSLEVNELVVFRSELSSKGSKYTALSRHKLSDKL
jgi:2'-5' RNA ligase